MTTEIRDEDLEPINGTAPGEASIRDEDLYEPGQPTAFHRQAKEDSTLQNVLAGAGGVFHGLGLGARQLLPGFANPSPGEVREWKRSMEGLRSTGGGFAGEMLGWGAASVPSMLLGPSIPGAAAAGAGLGALTPAEGGRERAGNILSGGGLGALGQWGGNSVAGWLRRPASSQLNPSAQQIAREFQEIGGRLTPGAVKGSPRLRSWEQILEGNALTGTGIQNMKHANQQLVNRTAAEAIGEQADDLGPHVLSRAYDRMGQVFDAVRDSTPVALNRYDARQITQLNNRYQGLFSSDRELIENPLVRQFVGFMGQGGATREQLGTLSSNLGARARQELTGATGDRNLGHALLELKDHVENRIARTLQPDARAAYDTTRHQYRNLINLETSNVIDGQGDVSAAQLGRILRPRDRTGYRMGRTDSNLHRIAHAGEAFGEQLRRPAPIPRTGFSRFFLPLSGPSLGVATAAATANPMLGAATGLGLLGVEGALGAAYPRLVSRLIEPAPRLAAGVQRAAHLLPAGGLAALQAAEE